MLLVLLMRHAQSESNATHEDTFDPPLTALGVEQARRWREAAPRWKLDRVLVSPLFRCIQTAAHALGSVFDGGGGDEPKWTVVPEAREHWWGFFGAATVQARSMPASLCVLGTTWNSAAAACATS